MGTKKISVYMTDKGFEVINLKDGDSFDAQIEGGLSKRLNFLLQAHDKITKESMPAMPLNYWLGALEAMNGHIPSYEMGAEFVVSGMLHNIYDSDLMHHDTTGAEVAQHIAKMPFAQQFAIFEVVRGFWLGNRPKLGGDWRESLEAMGARVT